MSKVKLILLSVLFTLMAFNVQAQTMNWVLLPNGTGDGDCISTTDCESGLLCYGLEYTSNVTGVLTSYTTGFFATCGSAGNPIFSNSSCVMVDNSQAIEACTDYGLVLFNSSGNSGNPVNNTITAGVPVILHQVCFAVSSGDYTIISEDNVTDLTTNIDLPDGTSITEFPVYSEFILDHNEICGAIAANDDDFSATPVNSIEGGLAGNVLVNDELNGIAVFAADVEIDLFDDGGLTGVTIDIEGNLNVPAGTPAGTYYINYQICEIADLTNCDDAIVTIVVEGNLNTPTALAGADIEVCEDMQFVELNGQALNASGVMWSGGSGFYDDPQALSTVYYFSQEDILAGTVELCLTAFAIDPATGNNTDCLTLTLIPAPVAVAGENNTICEGEAYSFTDASASGYSNLEWTTNGDGVFDLSNIENPVYTPGTNDLAAGSAELCLTAWPQSGCTEPDVDCMTLSIMVQPTVEIAASTVDLNCENYDEINGEWLPVAMEANITGNPGSVLWTTTGDGFFNDPTAINAVYYLGLDDIWRGDVQLCIEVQDAGSCQFTASDCMMIHVPQQLIYFDADTWFGVSSYLNTDQNTVPEVMDPLVLIPGSQNLVKIIDENGKYFWPEPINPTNTLDDWAARGYKIKTKNTAACLPIYGDSLSDQSFTVDGRFTYLPVLTNVPANINNLFGSNLEKILLIYDWSTTELWTQAASDFNELMPGRAYLLVNKSTENYIIEYPDFDPAAPHLYNTTKDAIAINNSPWNDIENTSQPHILIFSSEATNALQPGDIIGTFNSSDECFGMVEYNGMGSLCKLIAMGNDPYSRQTDGFETGEQMRFKLYRPNGGISMDVTLEFDSEYPNFDGLFAPNGASRVIGLTMAITSVNDQISIHNINVFPNPAIDIFNITSDQDMRRITMINHVGQKVISREVRGKAVQVNASGYAPGMYFLRIETNDGKHITKRISIE
jgi:hypothetical protein